MKTIDKKNTFLDVLVRAIHEKYPELVRTGEELSLVTDAERGTFTLQSQYINYPVSKYSVQ